MDGHSIAPTASPARDCAVGTGSWGGTWGACMAGSGDVPLASTEGSASSAPPGTVPCTKNAGTTGSGTCNTEGVSACGPEGMGTCTEDSTAGAAAAVSADGSGDASVLAKCPGPDETSGARAGSASGAPHSRSTGSVRRTGAGGARKRSNAMSGSKGAGTFACRWAEASNTNWQCPQRTHPSEMRNWSATTLNRVPQDGQRVVWLMGCGL